MKKNKKQLQSEQTRERFIQKLSEIIRNGEADTFNIRGLCKELGFSPRTFYLYFESKEHAINQCYVFQEHTFVKKVEEINHECDDPWVRLMNIFKVASTFSEQEIITVQRRLISVLRVYDHYIHSNENQFYKLVKREVENCIHQKHMEFSIDSETLTWHLILFYRGNVYNYLAAHKHHPLLEEGPKMIEKFAKAYVKKGL